MASNKSTKKTKLNIRIFNNTNNLDTYIKKLCFYSN